MLKKVIGFLIGLIVLKSVLAADSAPENIDLIRKNKWVDSVFSAMTDEERIGQLFMVAAYSNQGDAHMTDIEFLIRKYRIGGLIFFQGGPVRQALLTNQYQNVSQTPLFIATDAEWGLAMRLDSVLSFPKTDDSRCYSG